MKKQTYNKPRVSAESERHVLSRVTDLRTVTSGTEVVPLHNTQTATLCPQKYVSFLVAVTVCVSTRI